MKIFQLCLRVPFPAHDGGTMAMVSLADGLLANGIELHMFSLNTSKHHVSETTVNKVSKDYNLQTVDIDNNITALKTVANLLGSKPFHVSRFYNSAVASSLLALLQKHSFDVVIFESIFMAPYLALVKAHTKAKTVLRSHNVEYRIWERLCVTESNPIKRYYLNLQMKRLKGYEKEMTRKFDLVAAITSVDQAFYKSEKLAERVIALSFGLDVRVPAPALPHEKGTLSIGFLGSMNWLPNVEGVQWFIKEVWPLIAAALPQVRCTIRGHHMSQDLIRQSNGRLEIGGSVEDATEFFRSLDVSFVPLKSGSGVRIKVLEAMALGVPVISTSIGYEGVQAQANQSILEADTPEAFVGHIESILQRPEKLSEIGQCAQDVIRNLYDKKKCASFLLDAVLDNKAIAS